MAVSSSDAQASKPSYDNTIYFELSPPLTWLVRVVNIIVILMILITMILCIVQAKDDHSYYLLLGNLGISVIVCSVVNWWYKSGDLGSEKFWFVLLLGVVILFQCISFDVFIFKEESSHPTTPPPTTRTTPSHNKTQTLPWTTMIVPSTKNSFV